MSGSKRRITAPVVEPASISILYCPWSNAPVAKDPLQEATGVHAVLQADNVLYAPKPVPGSTQFPLKQS